MTKVAVIGATGYTGEELVRILSNHPKARISYVSGKDHRDNRIDQIFPYLKGRLDLDCPSFQLDDAVKKSDFIFLSLPHTVSMQIASQFLNKGKRVIDISADYRLKDPEDYARVYGQPHMDIEHLKQAVYGLPELNRKLIRKADLVANPGCYPTGAILGLLPALEKKWPWIGVCVIDSKSGVTGAGRKASKALHFSEIHDGFKPYRVFDHPHNSEIAQVVTAPFVFVPHLAPMDRGILSTLYVPLGEGMRHNAFRSAYEAFYAKEGFVQVLPDGEWPNVKNVRMTNQCHIGLRFDEKSRMGVVVTAIDNLGKGAAGQAVQNMNLMLGLDEKTGLF